MARRVGSARAAKTCSAIASMSRGIEIGGQFTQLARPELGVAIERLAGGVLRQLGEPGLDDRQPGPRTGWFEGELDTGTARILLGQPVNGPGEPEHRRLLPPFHAHVDRGTAGPPQPGRPPGRKSIAAALPDQAPSPQPW